MNRMLSLALLVAGLVLLYFGFNASHSLGSNLSEAVQGAPSDKSITLIVLGTIAAIVGGWGIVRGGV